MIRDVGAGAGFGVPALVQLLQPTWIKTAPLIDVFLGLNVLHERRPAAVTGVMLGAAVQRLVACEVQPGGPYATAPGVVDLVANACIAVFIGWAGKPLPGLLEFLGRHYDTMMLTTATAPFDGRKVALSPLAAGLLAAHSADPAMAGERAAATHLTDWGPAARRVLDEAERVLADVPDEVLRHSRKVLQTFDHGDDRGEVRLMSTFFAQALASVSGDVRFWTMLGVANMHTWLAYTIYDDFYDNEAQPHLLPSANVSMRLAQRLYLEAVEGAAWQQFVSEVFDRVDAANAWEVTRCRFEVDGDRLIIKSLPDMGNWEYIADRAYFHALGPMAVVARCGILPGDSQWQAVWRGFGHYLVARQCNDDLLDWRADLQAGQSTPVVLSLLRYLGVNEGAHSFSALMPQASQVFWRDVLPEICKLALERIALARQEFTESGLLGLDRQGHLKRGEFTALLEYIEGSLHEALAARQQSQEFLSTFK